MAYCDGETLKDRIAGGPIHIADAISIGIQVASALRGLLGVRAVLSLMLERGWAPGDLPQDRARALPCARPARMPLETRQARCSLDALTTRLVTLADRRLPSLRGRAR